MKIHSKLAVLAASVLALAFAGPVAADGTPPRPTPSTIPAAAANLSLSPLPDLVVTEVDDCNFTGLAYVTITNQTTLGVGQWTGNFEVYFQPRIVGNLGTAFKYPVGSLGPGQSAHLTVRQGFANRGFYLDSDHTVTESNEDNNTGLIRSIHLCG